MTVDGNWIRITECRNVPPREGRAVNVGGHDVAIFNLGNRFLAIQNRCPHKGGPLADGIVSGATVVCPLHAWKVNLATGTVTSPPPAQNCVRTFCVRVEDGWILLGLRANPETTSDSRPAESDEQSVGPSPRSGAYAPHTCESPIPSPESEAAL